jgi:flagellar hook protein FlgE
MIRSLYSAVSGLKNHQTKMDVIGNNIANVNTTGFKRSRTNFATMLSQTLTVASPQSIGGGGTNASQVGLGSMIGSIDQIVTQGSSQTTGRNTDLMIQGSGYFAIKMGDDKIYYTRNGDFGFDNAGYLVEMGTGGRVLDTSGGEMTALPSDSSAQDVGIDKTGKVTYLDADGAVQTFSAPIGIFKFTNEAGLNNVGNGLLAESTNSGAPVGDIAGIGGRGAVVSGSLEMSNVDLSTEMTDMIVAQRGFQANSRVITVSDSLLQELIDLKRQ